jgi:NADH:ubiquinone oxidoreductase subunit D
VGYSLSLLFLSLRVKFTLKYVQRRLGNLDTSVKLTAPSLIQAALQPSKGKFSSMESLISHFRLTSEGWPTNPGFTYQSVESPKGEVGVTLVSNGTSKPTRLKLRTPVSHNMHLIPTISIGTIFADFVATFCSLDIVLGEIDR